MCVYIYIYIYHHRPYSTTVPTERNVLGHLKSLLLVQEVRNAFREELSYFEDIVISVLYEVHCKYCEKNWSSDTAEI